MQLVVTSARVKSHLALPPINVPGGGLFYILRKNLAMCTMWNLIVVDVSRIGKGLRQHMGTDKMLKSKTCQDAAVGDK